MIKTRVFIAIVIAISALGIIGCGGNVVRREVEKSVASALPDIIGPADSYSVKAEGPSIGMLKGKVRNLDIIGTNVKFAGGISVARLVVNIKDVTFDTDNRKIKRVASTRYTATLSQDAISSYVAKNYPDVPGLKVELRNGLIGLSAKPGISRLRMGVNANAALEVRNQRILALDLKTLRVAGIAAPAFVRELVDSRLDTIFDAADLGFDAHIASAKVENGALTLSGDLDLLKMAGK